MNCVVTLRDAAAPRSEHEDASRTALAQRIAALLGYAFAGEYVPHAGYADHVYFVPQETLLRDEALALHIRGERDLFGGVVPDRFVGTKAITHAMLDTAAHVPPTWSHELAGRLRDLVLPGYSAFSPQDVLRAGRELLRRGRVRVKPAHGKGGIGQRVASDTAELDAVVAALDADALRTHGVAVELDIDAPRIYSIGEVHVAGVRIAYYGVQRRTRNHRGRRVYGGSDLRVVRGSLRDLFALCPSDDLRRALDQALHYDRAVSEAFPGFFASRRNYDVLQGRDRHGEFLSGVLEQSWRIGGASPAEIAALRAFRADPGLHRVRACSREVYADDAKIPAHADVHFDGIDADIGRLRKYSVIKPDR